MTLLSQPLERSIDTIARIWAINTFSNANSKNIDIPSKTAAGIMKYQNFSSKKDSSSNSSSSHKDDEQAIVVIISHLCNNWIYFN